MHRLIWRLPICYSRFIFIVAFGTDKPSTFLRVYRNIKRCFASVFGRMPFIYYIRSVKSKWVSYRTSCSFSHQLFGSGHIKMSVFAFPVIFMGWKRCYSHGSISWMATQAISLPKLRHGLLTGNCYANFSKLIGMDVILICGAIFSTKTEIENSTTVWSFSTVMRWIDMVATRLIVNTP